MRVTCISSEAFHRAMARVLARTMRCEKRSSPRTFNLSDSKIELALSIAYTLKFLSQRSYASLFNRQSEVPVSACFAYAFQRMFRLFSHDHGLNGGQDRSIPTSNSQRTLRSVVPMDTQIHRSSGQNKAIPTFNTQLAFSSSSFLWAFPPFPGFPRRASPSPVGHASIMEEPLFP